MGHVYGQDIDVALLTFAQYNLVLASLALLSYLENSLNLLLQTGPSSDNVL